MTGFPVLHRVQGHAIYKHHAFRHTRRRSMHAHADTLDSSAWLGRLFLCLLLCYVVLEHSCECFRQNLRSRSFEPTPRTHARSPCSPATICCSPHDHHRDNLFGPCLFRRLARQPHDKVLNALSIDDTPPFMPILMPRADCDFGTALSDQDSTIQDKLG